MNDQPAPFFEEKPSTVQYRGKKLKSETAKRKGTEKSQSSAFCLLRFLFWSLLLSLFIWYRVLILRLCFLELCSAFDDMADLLDDVVFEILSRMTPSQVLRLSAVCKQWHQIATSNSLWEQLCLQTFGSMENEGRSWLQMFRELGTPGRKH
jgi:hypothetical protein